MPAEISFDVELGNLAQLVQAHATAATHSADAARFAADHLPADWRTSRDPRQRAVWEKVHECASRCEGAAARARVQVAGVQVARDHDESAQAICEAAMSAQDAALHLATIVRMVRPPEPL